MRQKRRGGERRRGRRGDIRGREEEREGGEKKREKGERRRECDWVGWRVGKCPSITAPNDFLQLETKNVLWALSQLGPTALLYSSLSEESVGAHH